MTKKLNVTLREGIREICQKHHGECSANALNDISAIFGAATNSVFEPIIASGQAISSATCEDMALRSGQFLPTVPYGVFYRHMSQG